MTWIWARLAALERSLEGHEVLTTGLPAAPVRARLGRHRHTLQLRRRREALELSRRVDALASDLSIADEQHRDPLRSEQLGERAEHLADLPIPAGPRRLARRSSLASRIALVRT